MLVRIKIHCLNRGGGVVTRNKVVGSSAPKAVFVFFGGMGLVSQVPKAPSGGFWPRPRGGRSACAGGRGWPKASGAMIGLARLSPRPFCARIGSVLGARPLAASHGDAAPAPLRAVPGHRSRGVLSQGGLGCGNYIGGAPSASAAAVTSVPRAEFY